MQRVGQLKGRVSLDTVTAVEFVDEAAFGLPHTFQVRRGRGDEAISCRCMAWRGGAWACCPRSMLAVGPPPGEEDVELCGEVKRSKWPSVTT